MTLTHEQIEAMTDIALRIALHHIKNGNLEFAEDHIREILAARLEVRTCNTSTVSAFKTACR